MIASLQFAGFTLVEDLSSLNAVCNYATPSGTAEVQLVHRVRAAWKTPIARGGAVTQLAIQLTFTEASDAAAFARLHDLFAQLITNAQQGDLIISHLDETIRTYADAVLVRYGPAPQTGVSNVMQLDFIAAAATETEALTIQGDLITITL